MREGSVRPEWYYPRAAASAALLLAVVNAILGERPIDPTVFDQVAYHWLATNMWEMLFQRGFIPVYHDRWFPSFVARVALTLTGRSPTIGPLAVYFELMLIAIFAAAGWLWGYIALSLRLTTQGLWIGFVLLFLNYFGLKFINWMPALTDGPALLFSLGLLWAFLEGRLRWLIAFGAMGSFTFPGFPLITAALIAFPRRPILPLAAQPTGGISWPGPSLVTKAHLILATTCAIAIAIIDTTVAVRLGLDYDVWPKSRMPELAPLSIAIASTYMFFAVFFLAHGRWWEQLFATPWRRYLMAFGFLAAVYLVRALITRTGNFNQLEEAYCNPCDYAGWYLYILFLRSFIRPAEFLVGQTLQWGLVLPLLLVCWRGVATNVRDQGLGLVLVIGFGVLLGYDKIGRHLTQVFPFFVAFLALTLDRYRLPTWSVCALAVLNVAASRFWYPHNRPGTKRWDQWQRADTDYVLEAMINGHPSYTDGPLFFAILATLAVVTLVLWLALRPFKRRGLPDEAAVSSSGGSP